MLPDLHVATDAQNSPVNLALAYLRAGLCPLPIRRDGSKRPALNSWKEYQHEPPTEEEIRQWWSEAEPPGIAILGGAVSGALECIDFDHDAERNYPEWCALVEAEAPGLVSRLNVIKTPGGGYHVRYRCPDEEIPGNTKLAQRFFTSQDGRSNWRVLIETRGEGGYALAPGSARECHPTGGLYEHYAGPQLPETPALSPVEREVLIRCARSFDQYPAKNPIDEPSSRIPAREGLSPGDDFCQRVSWSEILVQHGWTTVRQSGDKIYWRRPGKEGPGWSATTGACRSEKGRDLLYVFSTNAAPFEVERGYSKFAAYALLNHGGDFTAAARVLSHEGYGSRREDGQAKSEVGRGSASGSNVPAYEDQPPAHRTDWGNAIRLIVSHGKDVRYCHPWNQWLVWNGKHWEEDFAGQMRCRAKQTVAAMFRQATDDLNEIGIQMEDGTRV